MNSKTLEAARQVTWLGPRPAWHDLARCAETDPEMFFPEKGESVRPAKRVCAGCEVQAECLQDALDRGERAGAESADAGAWFAAGAGLPGLRHLACP